MRKELRNVDLFYQNAPKQRLNDDKFEELLAFMHKSGCFAFVVQETWRKGQTSVENHGFVMLCNGVSAGAARGGVSIVMSPKAVDAWISAGSSVMYFGTRIIAVKLKLLDSKNRKMVVRFVSAYAPFSTSARKVRNEYLDDLQKCIMSCSDKEVLIIATDANASMGTRT